MIKQPLLTILLSGILAYGYAVPSTSAETVDNEYRLKAAFIFNFTKFVDWPANAFKTVEDDLRFCVYGEDPFGVNLADVEGKMVQGRAISIARDVSEVDLSTCHVLFLGMANVEEVSGILGRGLFPYALTIADIPGFAKHGGMIQFLMKENKIRFEINEVAIRDAGLNMSSRLLNLAVKVHGKK